MYILTNANVEQTVFAVCGTLKDRVSGSKCPLYKFFSNRRLSWYQVIVFQKIEAVLVPQFSPKYR